MKTWANDNGTPRELVNIFALDGSTVRTLKKLWAWDGTNARLIFDSTGGQPVIWTLQQTIKDGISFPFPNNFMEGYVGQFCQVDGEVLLWRRGWRQEDPILPNSSDSESLSIFEKINGTWTWQKNFRVAYHGGMSPVEIDSDNIFAVTSRSSTVGFSQLQQIKKINGEWVVVPVLDSEGSSVNELNNACLATRGDWLICGNGTSIEFFKRGSPSWFKKQVDNNGNKGGISSLDTDGTYAAALSGSFGTPSGFLNVYQRSGDLWTRIRSESVPYQSSPKGGVRVEQGHLFHLSNDQKTLQIFDIASWTLLQTILLNNGSVNFDSEMGPSIVGDTGTIGDNFSVSKDLEIIAVAGYGNKIPSGPGSFDSKISVFSRVDQNTWEFEESKEYNSSKYTSFVSVDTDGASLVSSHVEDDSDGSNKTLRFVLNIYTS